MSARQVFVLVVIFVIFGVRNVREETIVKTNKRLSALASA